MSTQSSFEERVRQCAVRVNGAGHTAGVGSFPDSSSQRANLNNAEATVWGNGVRTDLDTLIPPDTVLTITGAWGINDAGQIVASAARRGQLNLEFAVLLTPVTG